MPAARETEEIESSKWKSKEFQETYKIITIQAKNWKADVVLWVLLIRSINAEEQCIPAFLQHIKK